MVAAKHFTPTTGDTRACATTMYRPLCAEDGRIRLFAGIKKSPRRLVFCEDAWRLIFVKLSLAGALRIVNMLNIL